MYLASLNQRIGEIAQRDFISLDDDTIIADAVKVMKEKGISSVFVKASSSSSKIVNERDKQLNHLNPIIGIVTERDILYRVIGQNNVIHHQFILLIEKSQHKKYGRKLPAWINSYIFLLLLRLSRHG
jgi:CBS domain-containing protein